MPEKQALSYQQVDRVAALCLIQSYVGHLFSIENPKDSLAFRSSPMEVLRACTCTWTATFDQCQYGLAPPAASPREFIKKATSILANFEEIMDLESSCPGSGKNHVHVHALGTRRVDTPDGPRSVSVAMLAGRYPDRLCSRIADVVLRAARRLRLHTQ
jgi:hypothetical protein